MLAVDVSAARHRPSSRRWTAATALAVVPVFAAAAALGLGSGPRLWAIAGFVTLCLFALPGASGRLRGAWPGWAAMWALAAVPIVVGLAAIVALGGGSGPTIPPVLRTFAFDRDARIPLDPSSGCLSSFPEATLLTEGSHPSVEEDGAFVWYEALASDGRMQVYRLEFGEGSSRCWTCDEPGQNRWPAANPSGVGLVFVTDRHAGRDVHAVETRLWKDRPPASGRLTSAGTWDTAPLYRPDGRGLVWSSQSGGRIAVRAASLVSGHGGLVLGTARTLVAGGLAWVAPLAWAPDARTLVVGRAASPGVQGAEGIDPATGERIELGWVAGAASVSFTRDGREMALLRSDAPPRVPAELGFLLSRLPSEDAQPGGTSLWLGPTGEELVRAELGRWAQGGALSGIAWLPDGRSLVVAERREGVSRLLHAKRDCPPAS